MIYEEDIEVACIVAAEILGENGRILYGEKGINYNVVVSSDKHGKLWYGDLGANEVGKLNTLKERLDVLTGQFVTVRIDAE